MTDIEGQFKQNLEAHTILFRTEHYAVIGNDKGQVKRAGLEFCKAFEEYLVRVPVLVPFSGMLTPILGLPIYTSPEVPKDVLICFTKIWDGILGHFYFGWYGKTNTFYLRELEPGAGVYFEEAEKYPFFKYGKY